MLRGVNLADGEFLECDFARVILDASSENKAVASRQFSFNSVIWNLI